VEDSARLVRKAAEVAAETAAATAAEAANRAAITAEAATGDNEFLAFSSLKKARW